MFLDLLVRRNRRFVEAVVALHREGRLPANAYVLDLDTMRANLRVILDEAARLGLTVYPMTKQIGRNPAAIRALSDEGAPGFVAVDMADARAIRAADAVVGHLGHLVQVPRAEAAAAAEYVAPDYWTVFSPDKAREAAEASAAAGRTQRLLARIVAPGDRFYMGHEGGFTADDVCAVADLLDAVPGGAFAGVTTFPALLFDEASGEVRATPNLATLERGAAALAAAGRGKVEINAPGTTSAAVLATLAAAGATQVEPGHALTGTTPLHAVRDLPEAPALLYLSEVSHDHAGKAYVFGGGMYVDPVFPAYQVRALAGTDPAEVLATRVDATLPPPSAIDYYGMLDQPEGRRHRTGDTVIFSFRAQAFFTRALVAPVAGIASGNPTVEGVWTSDGRPTEWPR